MSWLILNNITLRCARIKLDWDALALGVVVELAAVQPELVVLLEPVAAQLLELLVLRLAVLQQEQSSELQVLQLMDSVQREPVAAPLERAAERRAIDH